MRARIRLVAVALITVLIAATSMGSAAAASSPALQPAGIGGPTQQSLLATPGHSAASLASGYPWGLTHRDLLDIAGGLVALLLLLVVVLRVRRRRREAVVNAPEPVHRAFPQTAESWRGSGLSEDSATPLPPFERSSFSIQTVGPGWHPVQGDPLRMAYWDGSDWSAFRQWDGHQWVDPTSITT
jgi:hypothetical protein